MSTPFHGAAPPGDPGAQVAVRSNIRVASAATRSFGEAIAVGLRAGAFSGLDPVRPGVLSWCFGPFQCFDATIRAALGVDLRFCRRFWVEIGKTLGGGKSLVCLPSVITCYSMHMIAHVCTDLGDWVSLLRVP